MRTSMILLLLALLTGCASDRHVLFVTKTSMGVDFDQKPSAASIGYDRVEGYVGPRYGNGEVPPVIASVKSDGTIFSPAVRQLYATGDAAVIVAGGTVKNTARDLEGDDRKVMFFGTTTTTGIKISFTTGLPDSFVFGYKRKEFSYIPLATKGADGNKKDIYPSVLASIDTSARVAIDGKKEDTALTNSQFFATGAAAKWLATQPDITQGFLSVAADAVRKQQVANVKASRKVDAAIRQLVGEIALAYEDEDTLDADRDVVVKAAKGQGMDPDGDMNRDNFMQRLTQYADGPKRDEVAKQMQWLRDAALNQIRL